MSNFPAYLEHEVKECDKHVDEEGYPRVHHWIGGKACPECAGKKTANVHYEHYTVNLRAYKRLYSSSPLAQPKKLDKNPELWDAQGA